MKHILKTERFDIFEVVCDRTFEGGMPRHVYLAFRHDEDVPHPNVVVTVFRGAPEPMPNYVEFTSVIGNTYPGDEASFGIEVLTALEKHLGRLTLDPFTLPEFAFVYRNG
jgi:hypothetical protein